VHISIEIYPAKELNKGLILGFVCVCVFALAVITIALDKSNNEISLIFMAECNPLCICSNIFFTSASGDRHLGLFHFLATANSAPINMKVQMSF
jgi:hypothetical protein